MTDYIGSFSGRYRFLSNFYIEPDGSCVESEYQSGKTDPPNLAIRKMGPAQAKAAGRRVKLRADWESTKLVWMYVLVASKFDHPELQDALLGTGNAYLDEGNTWGDTFWGTVDGVGHNWLGRILMRVREEARDRLIPPTRV